MTRAWKSADGQTTTEATLLLPLFLLLTFAILQACHVGIAVAIVSYGASAVVRQAVERNDPVPEHGEERFKRLLSAGLRKGRVVPPNQTSSSDTGSVTSNVTAVTCAELPAYPLVGAFVYKALTPRAVNECGGDRSLGPVSVIRAGPSYHFVIRGQAKARMNYMSPKT